MRTASLLLLSLLLPSLAVAKPGIGGAAPAFGEAAPRNYESSQWFAVEIKFTPYTPHIDQSAGLNPGATPFADLFNRREFNAAGELTNRGAQPAYRLLTTVEFDVQFLHRAWGNLGFGVTTGYYRRSTHSYDLNANQMPCVDVAFCNRSGDETSLNILPLSALFIYRFDLLANRYKVPLVPYFKIGLAYYIWWIEDGGGFGHVAQKPESAYGGTFGFVLHPGIALQLDFIERSVAKTLDTELGINHTYLFCELNYANITGFGASNKLNLSDTMLNAGIAFEF